MSKRFYLAKNAEGKNPAFMADLLERPGEPSLCLISRLTAWENNAVFTDEDGKPDRDYCHEYARAWFALDGTLAFEHLPYGGAGQFRCYDAGEAASHVQLMQELWNLCVATMKTGDTLDIVKLPEPEKEA